MSSYDSDSVQSSAGRRHLGADHMLVANTWRAALRAPKMAPWAESQVSTDYFRAVFLYSQVCEQRV